MLTTSIFTLKASLAIFIPLLVLQPTNTMASLSSHLNWLPRHLSHFYHKESILQKRQDVSLDSLDFTDVTLMDYNVPLSSDVINAIKSIADQSLIKVEKGVKVDQSGSISDETTSNIQDGSYQIVDSSSQYILQAADNGNLQIADASAAGNGLNFPVISGVVTQDDQDRFFFYYPSLMKNLGVSKIRVGSKTQIPIGTQVISLASIATGDSQDGSIYAFDTSNNAFHLVTCTYADNASPSKIFLVRDIKEGIATLQSSSVEILVTGGIIQDCALMQFVSPGYPGISA